MLEKDIENLIAKYPNEFFPKSGFKLIGQQVRLGNKYADIIFQNRFKRQVIVSKLQRYRFTAKGKRLLESVEKK